MPPLAPGALMSDAPPTLDPSTSVEGLLKLARARAQAGDAEGAGRTFAAALHLAETHDLWDPTARAQAWLAGIDVRRGRLPLARHRLDRARAICVEHALGADTQAEVASQLGQVLVFQGQLGAGVAMMAEAVGHYRSMGLTAEENELELALAAIQSRVEQSVQHSTEGSEEWIHATVRRAEVRLGLGSRGPAREDWGRAWAASATLSASNRTRIGLEYSRLLVSEGPAHHRSALAVLQTIRADLPEAQRAEVDHLVASIHIGAPES